MICIVRNSLLRPVRQPYHMKPVSSSDGSGVPITFLRTTIHNLKKQAIEDCEHGRYASAKQALTEAEKLAKQYQELDVLRARVLHELAFTEEIQGNLAKANRLYRKCLKLEEKLNDNLGMGTTLYQLAYLKSQQQHIKQAIALYQQAHDAQCLADDIPGQAATLHQLAHLFSEQGDISSAIQYYQRLRNIDAAGEDQQAQAAALYQLGYLLAQEGDFEGALAAYQESFQLDSSATDTVDETAMTLAQMARLQQTQGNLEQAKDLYQQALKTSQKIDGALAQNERAIIMHYLGNITADLGNADDALALYREALPLDDDPYGKASILTAIGRLLAEQKQDFVESLRCLQKALQLLEQIGSDDSDYVRGLISSIQQAMA